MYLWAATGKGSNPGGKLSSFTGCLSIVDLGMLVLTRQATGQKLGANALTVDRLYNMLHD